MTWEPADPKNKERRRTRFGFYESVWCNSNSYKEAFPELWSQKGEQSVQKAFQVFPPRERLPTMEDSNLERIKMVEDSLTIQGVPAAALNNCTLELLHGRRSP